MSEEKPNERKELRIPMPDALYNLLVEAARRDGVSLEGFAEKALRESMANQELSTFPKQATFGNHEKTVSG